MTYTHKLAHDTALEWGLDVNTIEQWQADGIIPDKYALHKNNQTPARIDRFEQLIVLCAQGYLKAEYICNHMGWGKTKLAVIITSQRYPDQQVGRSLYGEEIDEVFDDLLLPLHHDLDRYLRAAWLTTPDQPYEPALQRRLGLIVSKHPVLNPSRLSLGLPDVARMGLRKLLNGTIGYFTEKNRPTFVHALTECQRIVTILTEPTARRPLL